MIKRNFITQILGIVILFIFSLITQNTHAQQLDQGELPSLKGKKILMVWGGWEGHEPKQVTYKLKPLLEKEGAIITVSDSLGVYANKELMSSVDLII
jgi:hypothetical protein